jgi:hypothetical protein
MSLSADRASTFSVTYWATTSCSSEKKRCRPEQDGEKDVQTTLPRRRLHAPEVVVGFDAILVAQGGGA